jgi:hypothetical protein
MQKIAVFGAGHLGKIHLKCLQMASDVFELVGFYDPDDAKAAEAEATFAVRRFQNAGDLMAAADVVDIVTPTIYHHQVAKTALQLGKHIFIEKPLTHTLAEAEELIGLAQKTGVKAQVGHVERFNPALLALGDMQMNPMFIEGHRLATFNPRGTDVSVILDLMIHDLDIVLDMVPSDLKAVHASGVAVVSNTPDIANARLEFANGCVANLTASRISLKQMRKLRLFQKDAYISLDFLEKNAQVVRLYDQNDPTAPASGNVFELETPAGKKKISVEMPPIEPVNAIKMELEALAHSIETGSDVKVPLEDGYRALKVAYQILEKIER